MRDPFDSLIAFLSSIRFGLYLLIALVIISFIGAIIPQKPNTSPETLQKMFAPANLILLDHIGILDLFHAGWFKALLTLLGLNIVFASLDRFSTAWRYIKRPATVLSEAVLRAQHEYAEIHLRMPPEDAQRSVFTKLKSAFGSPKIGEKDGRKILFVQKHVYSRLAAYGIHLSLLIIFAGGMIGLQFGYRGRIQLSEGESTSKVLLFDFSRNIVEASAEPRVTEKEMPFSLRLEKAEVMFNNPKEASLLRQEDIQSPGVVKNWYCTMSIWENGRPVGTQVVAVNQPLTHRGFRFYQSGFDFGEGFKETTLLVRFRDDRGKSEESVYRLHKGESMEIKEAHMVATPLRGGVMPQTEIPFIVLSLKSRDGQPPVQMPVFDENTTQKMRTGNPTAASKLPNGADIFLINAVPEFSTVLQVSRDPGVTTVWAGCILLVIGLMVAFYLSHQRVWAMVIPTEQGTTVLLAGDASKNRPVFSRKFQMLVHSLSESHGPPE